MTILYKLYIFCGALNLLTNFLQLVSVISLQQGTGNFQISNPKIFIQYNFICCSVGICSVLFHNSSFEILTGYMTSKYVIGISLQTL